MLTHVAEDDSGIPVDSNYKVVVCDEEGLDHQDSKQIYLIDHACTWRSKEELRYYLGKPICGEANKNGEWPAGPV